MLDRYQKGQTVTFDLVNYPNPLLTDPEFQAMKEKKKAPKIAEFAEQFNSGKIQPNVTHFSYEISETDFAETSQMVLLSTVVNDQTYTSMGLCQNDSMFLTRNGGPVVIEYDGKVLAWTIQGVQVLPLKLKVGDFLPAYEDITMTPNEKSTFTVKDKVWVGVKTSHYIERNRTHLEDGVFKHGDWDVTSTEDIYKEVDVEVTKTSNFQTHTINYAIAFVSGKEEIDVTGEKMEAFVIDSERWIKSSMRVTYESANKRIQAAKQKFNAKVQENMEKWSKKSGLLNEDGYIVIKLREWYVPGMGVVKYAAMDAIGLPTSETVLASIE